MKRVILAFALLTFAPICGADECTGLTESGTDISDLADHLHARRYDLAELFEKLETRQGRLLYGSDLHEFDLRSRAIHLYTWRLSDTEYRRIRSNAYFHEANLNRRGSRRALLWKISSPDHLEPVLELFRGSQKGSSMETLEKLGVTRMTFEVAMGGKFVRTDVDVLRPRRTFAERWLGVRPEAKFFFNDEAFLPDGPTLRKILTIPND